MQDMKQILNNVSQLITFNNNFPKLFDKLKQENQQFLDTLLDK